MDFCTQLSLNLLIEALKNDKMTNLVISPMSYNVILNMIAGGANGSTLKEMKMLKFLQFTEMKQVHANSVEMMGFASDMDENNGGAAVMQCLNEIWLDQCCRLNTPYQALVCKLYKAQVQSVDFRNKGGEVVEDANGRVKVSTKGLMTDVLRHDELDGAKFVIESSLHFKGVFAEGFSPDGTKDMPFYLMNKTTKTVPFMINYNDTTYKHFEDFEVVSIPYQRGGEKENMFSMYFFIPTETYGVESLLHKVASDGGFLRRDFKLNYCVYYAFWIPKFKFNYCTSNGVERMKQLGLKSPFDPSSSELTEMINGKLFVSKIVQNSFIEVDEKGTKSFVEVDDMGTEAYDTEEESESSNYTEDECESSYRGEECGSPLSEESIEDFIVDQPFMFMIREEKSKFILFTGVVLDPSVL